MNQNLDDRRSGVKISQEGSLLTANPVSPRSLLIDPEFKNLIPPLSTDERRQLETNLVKEGCRDPLVVWAGHDILLDGHNRWEICCEHGIDFQTVEIELPDWEAARNWIINNQLSRRNLTKEALRDFQRINSPKKTRERLFSRMIIIKRGRKGLPMATPFSLPSSMHEKSTHLSLLSGKIVFI